MPRLFSFDLRKSLGILGRSETRRPPPPSDTRPLHIWVLSSDEAAPRARLILEALLRQPRPVRITLVVPQGALAMDLPAADEAISVQTESAPIHQARMLRHDAPDLALVLGAPLSTSVTEAAEGLALPVIWAEAVPLSERPGLLGRRERRRQLESLAHIFARDLDGMERLQAEGAPAERLTLGGMLTLPAEPLTCSEAERSSFAARIRTRPVWLAAALPETELETVLAAHRQALRHAHRMLLLLAPEDDQLGPAWADRLEAEGWRTARRSLEGEADEDVQIFIADDAQEYGLWYRLAPMTYMGGTLSGRSATPHDPLEAAALGSALVHGPVYAPHSETYSRLIAARASRALRNAGQLGDAVADLIAPDRAALLAQNAWGVSSGGAGFAEQIAATAIDVFDARAAEEG